MKRTPPRSAEGDETPLRTAREMLADMIEEADGTLSRSEAVSRADMFIEQFAHEKWVREWDVAALDGLRRWAVGYVDVRR